MGESGWGWSVFTVTFELNVGTREKIKDSGDSGVHSGAEIVFIHLSTIVTDSVNRLRMEKRSSVELCVGLNVELCVGLNVERCVGLNGGGDNIGAPQYTFGVDGTSYPLRSRISIVLSSMLRDCRICRGDETKLERGMPLDFAIFRLSFFFGVE